MIRAINMTKKHFFSFVLAVMGSVSIWVSAQPATQAGQVPKPEDWYKFSDRKSLMLRDMMFDADEGKLEAMVPLGLTLLSGWGRAEGPHPQAAIYWLNAAADRGEHTALRHLAVVYASGAVVPRDDKKAYGYLDAYAAKTGRSMKSEECGDDEICSRYRELLLAHCAIHIQVPGKARMERLGGEFFAVIDLATKQIKVSGTKNLEVFDIPLRLAVADALTQIPMPPGLPARRKTLKLNFDMQVPGK